MSGRVLVDHVGLVFIGNVQVGRHVGVGERGLHLVAADEPLAEGAADRKRRDHAEGGGGDGGDRAARNPVEVFKVGTEGRGCAEAAHHRNRTREDAVVKVVAHELGDADADAVLHEAKGGDGRKKRHKELAALLDELQACHQADRGEEGKHQHRLQLGVERDGENPVGFKHRENEGNGHAAHDGARDREAFKEGDALFDGAAAVVGKHGKRKRLHHVDVEGCEGGAGFRYHWERLRERGW